MPPAVPFIPAAVGAIGGALSKRSQNKAADKAAAASFSDPFKQYGMGDPERRQMGQDIYGATRTGIGNMQNWSGGNIGGILGNLGGAINNFSGGGFGGGGGGGGYGGGGGGGGGNLEAMRWFNLGPEAMALKDDPYSDEYISRTRENELSRFGQGISSGREGMGRQSLDMARRTGIDPSSPAFMKHMAGLQAESGQQEARGRRDIGSQLAQQAAQAKIENLRQLAGMETQGGLGNLQASAQDRGSSRSLQGQLAAAAASRYGSSQAAGAARYGANMGLMGNLAGLSYDASKTLGSGSGFQNIGRPYSLQQPSTSSGWGGVLGAGLGGFGAGYGMRGMFGGGGGGGPISPTGGIRLGGNKTGF